MIMYRTVYYESREKALPCNRNIGTVWKQMRSR